MKTKTAQCWSTERNTKYLKGYFMSEIIPNLPMALRLIAAVLVVFSAYLFGYHNGQNQEELENARLEISALTTALEKQQAEQARLSTSLTALRSAESRARDDALRVRGELEELERRAKTDADRERNRCLRLAAEGKRLLQEARRAIDFCEENHK